MPFDFTLMHRPSMQGRPGHLIAYVTKVPAEGLPAYFEDAHQIVHPDGRVTTDAEIMFPSAWRRRASTRLRMTPASTRNPHGMTTATTIEMATFIGLSFQEAPPWSCQV